MAVAKSAVGSKQIGFSPATSTSYSGITVNAGDTALLVTLALGTGSTSGWLATWDSGGTNQAMTPLASKVTGSSNTAMLLGLRSPTPGNKTLNLSWTGSQYPSVCAISFTGSDTTSDANAFKNAVSGTASSLTVASTSGDCAVAMIACSALTSLGQTSLYFDGTSPGADSDASYAAGASSVIFTASGASGSIAMVGIDIVAAATASTYGYLKPNHRPLLRR